MAKRLRMTNADYVAIAVSPALIMALVGSLVFFLIEVLYVGQYQARLNYVFALFVFAAVLIGRISIEMGSERAAMYGAPLALAVFLVLAKFVEHPSPYSSLINIALIVVVWWSAHKLTWDCTLIDDNEDASGEGLMQRIGVDDTETGDTETSEPADNELMAGAEKKTSPHPPGLWVLYFSLAALPLFGIGQRWIPSSGIGRRRFAFALLAIYVAAGLALLVTTSFLGLRRYLRQRRVEMPGPMAATWVVTGGVLIAIVMLLAALVPRPQAEYAISQVPWQAHSPAGLSSSRVSAGNDGVDDENEAARQVVSDEHDPNATATREGENPDVATDQGEQQVSGSEGEASEDGPSSAGEEGSHSEPSKQTEQAESDRRDDGDQSADNARSTGEGDPEEDMPTDERLLEAGDRQEPSEAETESSQDASEADRKPESGSSSSQRAPLLPNLLPAVGGFFGALKIVFYVVVAIALAYLCWTNRERIATAIADIARQLRKFLARLFGRSATPDADESAPSESAPRGPPPPAFASFRDPFATGEAPSMRPDELVRYTFEAFEAWAYEQGHPRRPDQTPGELLRQSVDPKLPMFDEARRLVQLYNQVAYAPGAVTAAEVLALANVWDAMRRTPRSAPLVTATGE